MSALRYLIAAAVLAASVANARPAPAPVYVEGSQYSAVRRVDGGWRLLSLTGPSIEVRSSERCEGTTIPRGVWLITRGDDGGLELIAPSDTTLPDGHSGRVALLPCEAPDAASALRAPAPVIEWLGGHAGAIHVD